MDWYPRLVPAVRPISVRRQEKPRFAGLSLVGETGFEPATARPPAGCATRLRHSPWLLLCARAGDGNRTRPRSLEGSCATTTPRPQGLGHVTGAAGVVGGDGARSGRVRRCRGAIGAEAPDRCHALRPPFANHPGAPTVTDVVITGAARTAIGSYGRGLKDVSPSHLGATAAKAAMERSGTDPADVGHVVFGNVIHTEPRDMYM